MTSPRLRRSLAATAALTLLALGGCAGSDDASSGGSTTESVLPAQADADLAGGAPEQVARESDGATGADEARPQEPVLGDPTAPRALIKHGNVALRSTDVGAARFDVQKIVDTYGGEIAEETTEADEEGEAERARLVLRIPVTDFAAAMEDLEEVADLIATTTAADDVTTQVIDTEVRIELQRRSIDRIQLLLDRAQSIRAIVGIERELSQREADLGSLEKRQAFLDDQTTMATITVSLERPADKPPVKKDDKDDTGFLAGLADGWEALTTVTVAALTVGGAVLPFALVLLVLGVPAYAVRRRVGGRPVPGDQAPAAG